MSMRKSLSIVVFFAILGGIVWFHTQKSSAAATLTPQDYLEIQQLYSRYYQTIDAKEGEAWASTFTPDGVFNGTKGHDALAASLRGTLKDNPLRHWHSNLTITPTTEGADGSAYVLQINIKTTPPSIATFSRYDDKLVKTAQGWRFKVRQRSSDTTIVSNTGR
jgi:hypothetical protein